MMTANTNETRITKALVAHLKAAGYDLTGYRDAAAESSLITGATTASDLLAASKDTEDMLVYFRTTGGPNRWVRLIYGNDIDLVSDYGQAPGGSENAWNAAMEAFPN